MQRNQYTQPNPKDFNIVIVGAGFAGIGMAIRLKQEGIHSFTIFEAGDDIGGTWRDNTYPGCACDIPSHMYSYSFELWSEWPQSYSHQPDILQYLKHCVSQHGLEEHIQYNTRVVDFQFEENTGIWHVSTQDGTQHKARAVIAGLGPLNKPSFPDIPGREKFTGPSFHSSEWRHDVELKDKRVAVIGTGASAIQIIPAIAPKVKELSVFQRTPPWVVPRHSKVYPSWLKSMFRNLPFLQRIFRWFLYAVLEFRAVGFVVTPWLMRLASLLGRYNMRKAIKDPELREKVTPKYTMGCKRVLVSDNYFPALARDNVSVIDNGVQEIRENAIVCKDGKEYPVDVLIYATGFKVYDFLGPITVTGRDRMDLRSIWRTGQKSYYGIHASGFPNFFFLVGPNTGLGHHALVFMMEVQMNHVVRCIRYMRKHHLKLLDVKESAQEAFVDRTQKRMQKTVWLQGGCQSWYLDEQGRNFTLWPGFTMEYWFQLRRFQPLHFEKQSY